MNESFEAAVFITTAFCSFFCLFLTEDDEAQRYTGLHRTVPETGCDE